MPDPRIHPIPTAADGFVLVGLASTQILAANARRLDAEIVNDGATAVYLARGNDAVVGSGMRLNPYGGNFRIGTENMFYGVINGISTDEVNVTVTEGSDP